MRLKAHAFRFSRVFNPINREYVRNAEVRLEGTNQIMRVIVSRDLLRQ